MRGIQRPLKLPPPANDKPAYLRLIDLLDHVQASTYAIQYSLGIVDVPGCIARANAILARQGRRIECLHRGRDGVAMYGITEGGG